MSFEILTVENSTDNVSRLATRLALCSKRLVPLNAMVSVLLLFSGCAPHAFNSAPPATYPTNYQAASNPYSSSTNPAFNNTGPENTSGGLPVDSNPSSMPGNPTGGNPAQLQKGGPQNSQSAPTGTLDPNNSNPTSDSNWSQNTSGIAPNSNVVFRGQDPGSFGSGQQQNLYQQTQGQGTGTPQTGFFPQGGNINGQINQQNNRGVGGFGGPNPIIGQNPPGSFFDYPEADLDVFVQEAQTGKIMVGGAFNSDNGVTGNIVIDEKNFDIARWPRNFQEVLNGTAWRGAGQNFRLELVPGNQVQRYLVSFTEPYLFNSLVSLSVSGYYYTRSYFDWDEQRLGGRVALGYRLNHDLSVSAGTRLESVKLFNERVNTSPQLNNDLGTSSLYTGFVSLIHDTRDHPFLATQGAYLELKYQQAFGDYDFPRGDIDYRRYFLLSERPDGSGRHTLNVGTKLGFSGGQTPVFENYFAGGFSTMRGFDFRGASPVEGGVRVGGQFQWLNTVEYMFPLTADDMIKGVTFVDFGTVEQDIAINSENFRIAPGFGFRVNMPAAGMGGAPLAFDFAFPISEAAGDDKQMFTFYLGVLR